MTGMRRRGSGLAFAAALAALMLSAPPVFDPHFPVSEPHVPECRLVRGAQLRHQREVPQEPGGLGGLRICVRSRTVGRTGTVRRTKEDSPPVIATLDLKRLRTAVLACAGNGQCVKDEQGAASCVCDPYFGLEADGKTCTDTCVLQECGENGQCVQDENGAASCVCDPGFTLRDDGKSCHDNSPNGPPDFVDLPPSAINRPCPEGKERDADGNCVGGCCGKE
ncbi:unnamed protein product [Closterium sp. Naga37s-1]|nr:unnamed protein product [Closterium sp. Naga37s-1]